MSAPHTSGGPRMTASSSRQGFWLSRFALLLALLMALPVPSFAQKRGGEDPETAALRKQAVDLYRAGKFVEAMPLLEKLSAASPQDYVLKEHLAYSVLEYSATLSDPAERKRQRIRPRELG